MQLLIATRAEVFIITNVSQVTHYDGAHATLDALIHNMPSDIVNRQPSNITCLVPIVNVAR